MSAGQKNGKRFDGVTVRKGIYYFPSYQDALRWAKLNQWPTDRIISYERGYAVQERPSGNYAGPEYQEAKA